MGITSAYPGILFNNQETEVIFVHINLIIICLQIFGIYFFSYNFFHRNANVEGFAWIYAITVYQFLVLHV